MSGHSLRIRNARESRRWEDRDGRAEGDYKTTQSDSDPKQTKKLPHFFRKEYIFLRQEIQEQNDDENDNLTTGNRLPLFSDHLINFPRDFFSPPPPNNTEQSSYLKRMPWGAVQTAIALEIKFQKLGHKERRQDASIPKPPTIQACGEHTQSYFRRMALGKQIWRKRPRWHCWETQRQSASAGPGNQKHSCSGWAKPFCVHGMKVDLWVSGSMKVKDQ